MPKLKTKTDFVSLSSRPPKPNPVRGLFDPKDPHESFSQIILGAQCEARYNWEYVQGHESVGRLAEIGRIGHKAIEYINRVLMLNKEQGIDRADIEAAKEILVGFKDYGHYSNFCEWMETYAAKANEERESIMGVEVEVQANLDLGNGQFIPIRGKIDRVDKGENLGECTIIDYKLWGVIPSREELEAEFQMSLYNWIIRGDRKICARFELNPLRTFKKKWVSVFHDLTMESKADINDAEDAGRYAKEMILKMIESHKRANGRYPETFNRRCMSCGRVKFCKTFIREMGPTGLKLITKPSLPEYVRYKDKLAVVTQIKEQVGEALKNRISEYGQPIVEGGFRAELQHHEGGQEVSFVKGPWTALSVKKVGRK